MSKLPVLTPVELEELKKKAAETRINIIKMIHNAASGHHGGSLSCVDILTVLYTKILKYHKNCDKDICWFDRDRFVLSKGHASPALYATLAQVGLLEPHELLTFRVMHSKLQGHPAYGVLSGIEASTGSLGQGLSIANGIAMGLRLDNKYARVYALLGDGELQEGQIWEAAMSSSHYGLNNLTAIIDRNCLQIDGSTECVMSVEPIKDKWKSFGWEVLEADGHDFQSIFDALNRSVIISKDKNAPVAVIAKTIKGKGVSFMEDNASWHGKAPNDEQYEKAVSELRGC